MYGTHTTLPEDLLLLCLDPRTRRIRQPQYFRYALAGAVLAELRLAGSVRVSAGRVAPAAPTPSGDPALDAALSWLMEAAEGEARGLPLLPCLRRLAGRADGPYLEALVARGLLRTEQRRMLGLFPRTVYFAESDDPYRERAARIDAVLGAGDSADSADSAARDQQLAALAAAGSLGHRLYPGRRHREPRLSLQSLPAHDEITDAVRRLAESDQSTAATAVSG